MINLNLKYQYCCALIFWNFKALTDTGENVQKWTRVLSTRRWVILVARTRRKKTKVFAYGQVSSPRLYRLKSHIIKASLVKFWTKTFPLRIFLWLTVTNWSRSGRTCSCRNPSAWSISCWIVPFNIQAFEPAPYRFPKKWERFKIFCTIAISWAKWFFHKILSYVEIEKITLKYQKLNNLTQSS